jgi:hypothetical protein
MSHLKSLNGKYKRYRLDDIFGTMSELWRFHSDGDAYFDLPGNAGQWPAN